ncbi:hypothetical protein KQI84_19295 [bacterium]|nr:hypothetical protein [bacterium]
MSHPFQTPEELVKFIETRLERGELDAAIESVADVDSRFPDSALAHHVAGLVHERAYIEWNARGETPELSLYEEAERQYRIALELEEHDEFLHLERLYACLFVLGTQHNDADRLREAQAAALRLLDTEDREIEAIYSRESAIVTAALARTANDPAEWDRAEQLFNEAIEPVSGREVFFFYYYRGLTTRELAQREQDQERFRKAAGYFRQAGAQGTNRALEFLMADCLVQLEEPTKEEQQGAENLVGVLMDINPADPLIESLHKRWEIRKKLLEGN